MLIMRAFRRCCMYVVGLNIKLCKALQHLLELNTSHGTVLCPYKVQSTELIAEICVLPRCDCVY